MQPQNLREPEGRSAQGPVRKALVLTVGVGRDVVRSLRLAVEHHNPTFVLFLCTPQSRRHVDELLGQPSFRFPAHHVEEFSEASDVQRLSLLYEEAMRGSCSPRAASDRTRST